MQSRSWGYSILVAAVLMGAWTLPVAAESPGPRQPDTVQEAGEWGKEIGTKTLEESAGIFGKTVLPVWRGMADWAMRIWQDSVLPVLGGAKEWVLSWIVQESETRGIPEEFEAEKREVADDLKKQSERARDALWDRFLLLFE